MSCLLFNFVRRIIPCLAAGIIAGALAGVSDIYRRSPAFWSSERLETAWVRELRPDVKDQYLMLIFERDSGAASKKELQHLLPSLLSMYMRLEMYDKFVPAMKAWAHESGDKMTVLALTARWAEDFLRRGDLERMRACREAMDRFHEDESLSETYRSKTARIKSIETILRLQRMLLAEDGAPDSEPRRAEIETLYEKIIEGMRTDDPSNSPVDVVRLMNAASPAADGVLDRLGETLSSRIAAHWDLQAAIELSVLADALLNQPGRWAEWERFLRRIDHHAFLPLRCTRDLSEGYLLWARDHRQEAAWSMLTRGVAEREGCPREVRELAARRAVEACPRCENRKAEGVIPGHGR